MRNKIIVGAILVLIAFLAGFVPEFLKSSSAKSEIADLKHQLSEEKQARTVADFRNAAALLYFEVSKSNFATAGGQATKFFTDLRQFTDQAPEPLNQRLNRVLANRDAIIAAIARADPSSATLIQSIFLQMQGF